MSKHDYWIITLEHELEYYDMVNIELREMDILLFYELHDTIELKDNNCVT